MLGGCTISSLSCGSGGDVCSGTFNVCVCVCVCCQQVGSKDGCVNSTHDSDYLTADVTTGHLLKPHLPSVNLSTG